MIGNIITWLFIILLSWLFYMMFIKRTATEKFNKRLSSDLDRAFKIDPNFNEHWIEHINNLDTLLNINSIKKHED